MTEQKYKWFYRFLFFSIAIIIFCLFLGKNLVLGGHLFLEKNFCQPSKFISDLYPLERVKPVEEIENIGVCSQTFFNEPVYFKVKIPRIFSKVKIILTYQNPDGAEMQLGLLRKKVQSTDWNYILKPLQPVKSDKNLIAKEEFFLDDNYINQGALEFMLSVPGLLNNGQEIIIEKIEARLIDTQSYPENFWSRIKSYFIKKIDPKQ